MARYIDMNELLNAIDKRNGRLPLWLDEILMEDCKVADVAPVVHGHWIRQDESFTRFKCSNPECGIENCSGFENYCPNCGAKMDKN